MDGQPMTRVFIPDADNTRDLRDALGCFATGVTVVTTATATGPLGMTANSFSSVSLVPPLVLWSPAKSSQRYPFFAAATRFAINVLREDQRDVALEFARRGDAFDMIGWAETASGVPVLTDCLTTLVCSTTALHDGGDHAIQVGKVEEVTLHEGRPLVFAQRGYGRYMPQD